MRTTINIQDDVLDRAKAIAQRSKKPFKVVVNEALRLGLGQFEKHPKKVPYRTSPHPLKLRRGLNLDNIQELLAQIEGEDFQ